MKKRRFLRTTIGDVEHWDTLGSLSHFEVANISLGTSTNELNVPIVLRKDSVYLIEDIGLSPHTTFIRKTIWLTSQCLRQSGEKGTLHSVWAGLMTDLPVPEGAECLCMNGCGRLFTSESAFQAHFVDFDKCGDVPYMVHKEGKNLGLPIFRKIKRRGNEVWSVNRPDLPEKHGNLMDSKLP